MKSWGSTVEEYLGSIMQFNNSMEYCIVNNYKYYEATKKVLWDLQSL